jgi:hypothetical protein
MGHDDFVAFFGFRLLGRLLTEASSPDEALTAVQKIRDMFREREGDSVFRSWMCGMNPALGDANPLLEIIAGNSGRVLTAARVYFEGSML